jgi:hypothetical protein
MFEIWGLHKGEYSTLLPDEVWYGVVWEVDTNTSVNLLPPSSTLQMRQWLLIIHWYPSTQLCSVMSQKTVSLIWKDGLYSWLLLQLQCWLLWWWSCHLIQICLVWYFSVLLNTEHLICEHFRIQVALDLRRFRIMPILKPGGQKVKKKYIYVFYYYL